jgi:hypothetical protein
MNKDYISGYKDCFQKVKDILDEINNDADYTLKESRTFEFLCVRMDVEIDNEIEKLQSKTGEKSNEV